MIILTTIGKSPKQPFSFVNLHKKYGWFIYLILQTYLCFTNLPPEIVYWRIGVSAVFSFITFSCAINAIDSRKRGISKGAILLFSVFMHMLLLTGYIEVGDGYVGALFTHFIVLVVMLVSCKKPPQKTIRNIEGAGRYEFTEVQRMVGISLEDEEQRQNCFNFGGIFLSTLTMFTKHSFVIGMSETGKSIWHSIMMQWFAFEHTKGFVHDYARNQFSKLIGNGVHPDRIMKANPFDCLGVGWLLSEDCDGKSSCKEMGGLFFPVSANFQGNKHFPETAGDIVGSVIYTFYRSAKAAGKQPVFDLSDVLNACLSRERIYKILSLYPDTKAAFSYLKSDNETNSNYMSTIRAGLKDFEAIAALGHHWIKEGRFFSLTRWIHTNKIILLGREAKRAKKALGIYNAAILSIAFRTILARETSDITPVANIGFFFDEFSNLGVIQGLGEMMRESRRHGASFNFANQDLEQLFEMYGKGEFNGIISQIKNWIFLTLNNEPIQKFAADLIGKTKYEKLKATEGFSQSSSSGKFGNSSSGKSTNYSWQEIEEYLFIPSEFQNLSRVDFDNNRPMEIIAKVDTRYNFRNAFSPDLLKKYLRPDPEEFKKFNYAPAPTELEELEPWTAEDYDRLCLPPDLFKEDDEEDDDDDFGSFADI